MSQPLRARLAPIAAAVLFLLHGAAMAQATQSLKEVIVNAGKDDGYSPATSSTATKGSAPLRDIPQSVNVVPGQLLRDQAAQSLEDALRNVPGVAMSSGDGQRDQVVIRGFTAIADQFIDGVRDDALYFRDLSNTERIEVLKGPAAVLYGRGSSGGLINRVTKKPKFGETFGEATLSLGSYSLKRLSADVNRELGESAALRITAATEDSGSYRDQQFVKRYSFAPSLALKLGGQTSLLLQYENARDKRVTDFGIPSLNGKPVNVPASRYYGSRNAAQDDTSTAQVSAGTATLNHAFSDALSLRNTTRYYTYQLDRYNTLPNGTVNPVAQTVGLGRSAVLRQEDGWFNQTDFTYKNSLGGLQQEWLLGMELGRQNKYVRTISAGNIATVNIFNPVLPAVAPFTAAQLGATSAIPSNSVLTTSAVYAQNQITLAKNWKALAGLRYDVYKQATTFERTLAGLSRTDSKLSPRAGLVWQPSDSSSYYVSYSKSFQPSGETFALASNNAGNEPEITQNREVGAKLDFFDGALAVTGSVFSLERSNIKNANPLNPVQLINVGKQRTNGFELTANGKLPASLGAVLGSLELSAGYAYLDGKMIESVASMASPQTPVVQIASLGKTAALTPRHSGFVWALKNLGDGFSVGGGLNYVGKRFTSLTNAVTLPSYLTADLAAYYKTKTYEIAVNLKNVTNKQHIVSSHGSHDNLILPGPPRQLLVSLTTKF
ncbi:TonB-dependent receptor [Polaromonas sp.]|uniref:TonB-dependent receptor n=1 Tax=Polaromonas sp. TaxID=1869339 RepID=UPI002FC8E404